MIIGRNERTPEYFGAVARNARQLINTNPYAKDDPRHKDWIAGYSHGIIEEAATVAQQGAAVH